jgi:pullulanase-type alpha-1,6-glucosidase
MEQRMNHIWALVLLCFLAACSKTSSGGALTLHYHRALSDYDGWQALASAGAKESSASSTSKDGFGAIYTLTPTGNTVSFSLSKGGAADAAGALTVDVSKGREVWILSGWPEAITRKLPALPDATHVALYYTRADQDYTGWGLHLWGDQVTGTDWGSPLQPAGIDPGFGAGFLIALKTGGTAGNCAAGSICLIAHNGGNKDPGPDMSFDVTQVGNFVFLTSGSTIVSTKPSKPAVGNAHLIARDTLAWKVADTTATFELRYSPTASITITQADVTGGSTIALTPNASGLSAAQKAMAPQLATYRAFTIAAGDLSKVQDALKGQLLAVARTAGGQLIAASPVQTAWALDDLYSYDGPLGVAYAADHTPTFRLWAPTAQSVKLHVFDAGKTEVTGSPVTLTAGANGVWSATGQASWYGGYYRYQLSVFHSATGHIEDVTVTDPYSANCSTNGLYAQIIDLADPTTKPAGWDALAKPALASDWAATDIVLYEAHVRDFSANDPTTPAARRGKYLGFVTDTGATQSNGLKHLQALAQAGLTHVHILPAFDFATVDEDPNNRVDVDQPFSALCAKNSKVPAAMCSQYGNQIIRSIYQGLAGDSQTQQTIAYYLKDLDSFNWGYDPFHYGSPEGSYASTADGSAKVLEFRGMVKGISDIGLRTVMDVVYNHTNAGGLADKSVLDKVVPGYYHRLDPNSGAVYNSTCCANTATEHHMMEKLMTDTLVRWARDYKVDGFRFDLMGHQPKAAMQRLLTKLAALTPATDGVDGSKIYLYGEGWDFGEVNANALFVQASQLNLGGTGIGTFNDRFRDAVRGGGPFDNSAALRSNQGFASGLYTDPNESAAPAASTKDTLGKRTDWIKAGMAGNLADFKLVNYAGTVVTNHDLDYNGAPTGYTQLPQEVINYAGVHDNQILFDILQAKLPAGLSMANRVRDHNLALDTVMLGEGVPFVHMGDEMLRSKSEDGNSYDAGDWFNRIDWSGQSTAWASGMPQSQDNFNNWLLITNLFHDASIAPGAGDIAAAEVHFRELLAIRKSTRLLRLAGKADVMKRVDFLNAGPSQVPGVIVMTVTDGTCAGADLDPKRDALVVIINATTSPQTMNVPGASGFTLHTVQQASADNVVKTQAVVSGSSFTVPARTSAVFEQLQTGAQGTGLPCNTH